MNKHQDIIDKKNKLDQIKITLKERFFGIDEQLDRIIDCIMPWYILPETLRSPIICNLIGMTGVGKTSVVRELVRLLGMSEKYLEIAVGALSENNSINEHLLKSSLEPNKPGIILFDEFQKCRTVKENGITSDDKIISEDLWQLLSDGKIPSVDMMKQFRDIYLTVLTKLEYAKFKTEWLNNLQNESIIKQRKKKKAVSDEPPMDPWDDENDYYVENEYNKNRFKNSLANEWGGSSQKIKFVQKHVFKGSKTEKEIWSMTDEELMVEFDKFIDNSPESAIDYTKCLIFIAANLDDAYEEAAIVEDCDTDADIYHEHTKKINTSDIKKCLLASFKPEQIARLGSEYIIYPSLDKKTYQRIINERCNVFLSDIRNMYGLTVVLDPDVENVIYENSVYPTQGTRPVFSNINKIFNSPISKCLVWCKENDYDQVTLSMDRITKNAIFTVDNNRLEIPVDLDIFTKKERYSEDFTALIAVHEAGHAIVQAGLFGESPKEIKINTASFTGGYNLIDHKVDTKESIANNIAVLFGGIVAEELIFGEPLRSSGCGSDIHKATVLASRYVRRLAMHRSNGVIMVDTDTNTIQDTDVSDQDISEILEDQKVIAKNIIKRYQKELLILSEELVKRKTIKKEQFEEMFKDLFKNDFPTIKGSDDIRGNYAEILKKKLQNHNK